MAMQSRKTKTKATASGMDLSDEIYRLAFQASPIAVLIVDQHGKIARANTQAENCFGYSEAEMVGQSIEMLLPVSVRRKHQGFRKQFFQEPETRPMGAGRDLMALRKDGSEFPVEIGLTTTKTKSGIMVMAVVADITKRKRAEEDRIRLEEKMQQAQKLESLGVLAGGIAHDFNNLLTGILGNADLALLDLSPVSPARENIEDIQTTAIRAADLCNQMLAYSGKGRFFVRAISLNDVIRETTHLLRVSISKTAIIRYNLYDDLPSIEADATQIRQVIMNLVTNASEAIANRSGVITITTGAMECDRRYLDEVFSHQELSEGVYVFLEVSDSGHGIKQENLKMIFDPFYTTKATGRGLGLAALIGIVSGHKGAVKVYSEVGKGTTFKIIFPSSEEAHVRVPTEVEADGRWRGHGKMLIIDDDETTRAVGRKMLEKAGFSMLTAQDGVEGLEILDANEDLRLVLLDLNMPHMTGEEVLRKIKSRRPDLPVIMTSGYNEQELASRFAGKALADFIQKPLRPHVLLAKVKKALST